MAAVLEVGRDARSRSRPIGHRFVWRGRHVAVPLGGAFNVMNSLAALTALDALGIDADDAGRRRSSAAGPVPGRFEVIAPADETASTVIVDYAHTPDGIAELLAATRAVIGSGAMTIVFGCGGDRDRDKRPPMGSAAVAGADRVIVTSDNPRDEDPHVDHRRDRRAASASRDRARRRRRTRPAGCDRAGARRRAPRRRRGDRRQGSRDHADDRCRVVDFDDRVVARELMEARS